MTAYSTSAEWSTDLTSLYPAFDSDCFALDSSTEEMIASLYPSPPLPKANDLNFHLHPDHYPAQPQPQLRRARSSGALLSSHASGSMSAYPMTTPSSSWSGSPTSDLSLPTPPEGHKLNYFGETASPISPAYGAYPEYPPVASTSYLPPSEPMAPSASIEEVNQFLNEMTTLLGSDAMSCISPSQAQPQPRKASYCNVSGVLLDEDDLAAFSRTSPPAASAYRSSYLEPSFAPTSHSQPQQSYGYYPDQAYAAYPPRTPTRPRQLRRPSSIELIQALPRSAPVYNPNHPYPQDLVGMGVYLPAEHTSPTPLPQTASSAGPQRTIRKMASMPNTRAGRKPSLAGAPAVPSVPRAVRKQPSASCFINFSASDSKALLNGVAPSGSSKRKRDLAAKDAEGDKKVKA